MKSKMVLKGIGAALLTSAVAIPTVSHAAGRMTNGQANLLFAKCQEVARTIPSAVRGSINTTVMWCGVVDREGKTLLIRATDTGEAPAASMRTDAWRASIEIALAKAYTAVSVSSDQQALTSEQVGAASQPGADLWGIGNTNPYRPGTGAPSLSPDDSTGLTRHGGFNHHGIVTFGGGVPVYDCSIGLLLGALGVSGDAVANDILVAQTAIKEAGLCVDPGNG